MAYCAVNAVSVKLAEWSAFERTI